MPKMNRAELARLTEDLGENIFTLRENCNESGCPFLAGLVRAAEESLVVVLTTLQDPTVREGDL